MPEMTAAEALMRAYDAHRWDALIGDELRDALDYATESIARLCALGFAIVPVEATKQMIAAGDAEKGKL